MPLSPTFSQHKPVRRVVADQLRAAIQQGQLKPGEWLRQERLAQELGVSQMPVREALKELAAEGLIEYLPFRGVRVMEYSADDVEDLYAQRSFLEGRAAVNAAQRITPEEISTLEHLQAQMKKRLGSKHIAEYRELNRQFHETIAVASRRPYLIRALNQMWVVFPTMLLSNFADTMGQPLPNRDKRDPDEHDAIIAALAKRNSAQAEQLVRQHIEVAGKQLIVAIKGHQKAKGKRGR
jgi:DNA-binding GntR family transcriptional regulator